MCILIARSLACLLSVVHAQRMDYFFFFFSNALRCESLQIPTLLGPFIPIR